MLVLQSRCMNSVGVIQSLSFTIQSHLYPMGLHTPPPFPQQEALNAHTVCFKTWRACIQKEKVEENSCIENICTVSSLPPQTAGASTVYEKRTPISTQLTLEQMFSLLGGVNEKEKRLSAALLNKMIQPRFKTLIKSFFLRHISARFLAKSVSLPFPQCIILWGYFCLFQRKTITTKRIKSPSLFYWCSFRFFKYALHDLVLAIQMHKIITNVTFKSILKWKFYFNGKAMDNFFSIFLYFSKVP